MLVRSKTIRRQKKACDYCIDDLLLPDIIRLANINMVELALSGHLPFTAIFHCQVCLMFHVYSMANLSNTVPGFIFGNGYGHEHKT